MQSRKTRSNHTACVVVENTTGVRPSSGTRAYCDMIAEQTAPHTFGPPVPLLIATATTINLTRFHSIIVKRIVAIIPMAEFPVVNTLRVLHLWLFPREQWTRHMFNYQPLNINSATFATDGPYKYVNVNVLFKVTGKSKNVKQYKFRSQASEPNYLGSYVISKGINLQ